MEKSSIDSASYWIEKLALQPHPEGGYYKEVFRSGTVVSKQDKTYQALTSIYFLLTKKSPSMFHSIESDEIWYYHAGNPVHIYTLNSKRGANTLSLGNNDGQQFQAVVLAGDIFAAESMGDKPFSLVSCAVAPGFEFEEFRLHSRQELLTEHPNHKELIEKFTK